MTRAEAFQLVSIMTKEEQTRYIINTNRIHGGITAFLRYKPFTSMRRRLITLSFKWLMSNEKFMYWNNVHIRYITFNYD